jgi:hypothetical protein
MVSDMRGIGRILLIGTGVADPGVRRGAGTFRSRYDDRSRTSLCRRIGMGAAVELSAPLATAVVGGMISSTLLTLIVVPAVYSLVESSEVSRVPRWNAWPFSRKSRATH